MWYFDYHSFAGIVEAAKALVGWAKGLAGRLLGRAGVRSAGHVGILIIILTIGYLYFSGSDGFFFYRVMQACCALLDFCVFRFFSKIIKFSYLSLECLCSYLLKICKFLLALT